MLVRNVDGVRNEAVEGLGDHGKVGGVLEELKRGGVHIEAILEKEVHRHPRKAPKALHPEPKPQQLPDRVWVSTLRRHHFGETPICFPYSFLRPVRVCTFEYRKKWGILCLRRKVFILMYKDTVAVVCWRCYQMTRAGNEVSIFFVFF